MFLQLVLIFLFSYSTMSNYLDQKPAARVLGGCWAGAAEPGAEAGFLAGIRGAPAPPQCHGWSGWPQTICWHHHLLPGQQDRVPQVVFCPNDQKPTEKQ